MSEPTRIDQIEANLYRIASDVPLLDGGFSFNQYLLTGDRPLLWHTGPRALFARTREAIARVISPEQLAFIGFAHIEADEMGALNDFLRIAPNAVPLCGAIAAMTSANDMAERPAHVMADGAQLDIGGATLRWIDAPHVPHGWENGYLFDETHHSLLCGDLFTQPGSGHAPLIEADILESSEAFRHAMDYYAHAPDTEARLNGLADLKPRTLACMHGSAWQGDGGALLRALGKSLASA